MLASLLVSPAAAQALICTTTTRTTTTKECFSNGTVIIHTVTESLRVCYPMVE